MTLCGRRICFAIASSILFLPGCAGLFNQARLDKTKSAQTAFTAAKLSESLDEERKQSQAMHARELAVTEQHFSVIRDAHLLFVTAKSPKLGHAVLKELVNERLSELGGGGARLVAARAKSLAGLEAHLDDVTDTYRLSRAANDSDARCTSDTFAFSTARAETDWKAMQKGCTDVEQKKKQLKDVDAPGEFNDLRDEMAAIDSARKKIKDDIAAADTAFKAAKKTLEDQRAANQTVDLKVVAQGFKDNLDAISIDPTKLKVPGIESLLAEANIKWLETLQTHVRALLDAAAKEDTVEVPAGVDNDLQIARILPGIAAQLGSGLRYPRVSALVLQSEHLRLELERARAEVKRVDQHIDTLRAKRAFMIAEATHLGYALAELETCVPDEKAASVAQISPPDCRNRYVSALISYANAWTIGRIPREKLEWALIQLQHERSFDQSTLALAQWQNLINVPLTALVKSYETGIKADEIGRTLNAAGIGWIGLGVN